MTTDPEKTHAEQPEVTTNNAPTAAQSPLNGNDAVNQAAERAKHTSHRNLPTFGDLPIDEDTANLRQGPNLHDGLLALLPLIGVWRGHGQAAHPGEEEYTFGQQLVFAHDGENRISFESRTWKEDKTGQPTGISRRESGFWRINDADEIELLITHSDGIVEIMYGKPLTERSWQLESASTMVTETGPQALGPGKRLYGLLPNNDLGWVDERLIDGEMVPWMSAQLQRVMG